MANAKYDQVSGLVASGSLNWRTDEVYALLCRNVVFDAAHTNLADAITGGATQISSARIEGRYVGTGGEAMGLPVTFPKVAKDTVYQALVVCDLGDTNPQLISFYDEDELGADLTIANNGTFILRPTLVVGAEPPTIGMWLHL